MVNTNGVEPAAKKSGLPLATLNHVSLVCRCLQATLSFYCDVLGFVPIRRPGSLDFAGAWLFNYGIGIHLLQAEDPESMPPKKTEINPKDNHISFQCESMEAVLRRLKEMGLSYVQRRVEEGGIFVDQVFFHDPDGFMIEVCTCDNLPIVPLLPEGYATLRMPQPPPAPAPAPVVACKRPAAEPAAAKPPPPSSPRLLLPAAVSAPAAATPPAPLPAQCVPAMASGGSYVVVGEVVDASMRPCGPEHACMQV